MLGMAGKPAVYIFLALLMVSFVFAADYDISACQGLESLENVTDDLAGNYYLTADIDCAYAQQCITAADEFTGNFYGMNHTISNINCTTAFENSGIFGKVAGDIQDVVFLDAVVTRDNHNTGAALVGWCNGCNISGVGITGTFTSGGGLNIGGISGYVTSGGSIDNVWNNLTITGVGDANRGAAMVGNGEGGCMSHSYFGGNTSSEGLQNYGSGFLIKDCFNIGDTTGDAIGAGVCTNVWWDINLTGLTVGTCSSGTVYNVSNDPTYWNAADKASNEPMDSWSYPWKMDVEGLPIFEWMYEAPPDTISPQWQNYTAPSSIYQGGYWNWTHNWTDDHEIDICSWETNISGTLTNVSEYAVGNTSGSQEILVAYRDVRNVQSRWYCNDTSGNGNATPVVYYTIIPVYPSWTAYGTNITGNLVEGSAEQVYSNWTDVNGLSFYVFQETYPNGSSYNTTATASGCEVCNFSIDGAASPQGNHTFKWFVNDSFNNWNSTPSYNLTVVSTIPQYSNVYTYFDDNGTVIPFGANVTYERAVHVYGSANWTASEVNLSHYVMSWYNTSHWQNYTAIAFTGNRSYYWVWDGITTYIPGGWMWKIFANTSGGWNVTSAQNFTYMVPGDGAATVTDWTINPCFIEDGIRQDWRVNTTVKIWLWLNDTYPYPLGTSLLRWRAVFYAENSTLESVSDWVGNFTTTNSTNHSLSLIFGGLSHTTANSTLVLQVQDCGYPYSNGTIVNTTLWYSVTLDGIEFGECAVSMGYITTPPEISYPTEGLFYGAIQNLAEFAGISISMLWLIVIIIGGVVAWVMTFKALNIMAFGASVLTMFALAVVGLTAGLFSALWFTLISVICLFIGGMVVKKMF